jgi:hypothetical protein
MMLLVKLREHASEELLLFVGGDGLDRGGELPKSASRAKSGNPPDAQGKKLSQRRGRRRRIDFSRCLASRERMRVKKVEMSRRGSKSGPGKEGRS